YRLVLVPQLLRRRLIELSEKIGARGIQLDDRLGKRSSPCEKSLRDVAMDGTHEGLLRLLRLAEPSQQLALAVRPSRLVGLEELEAVERGERVFGSVLADRDFPGL